METTRTYSSDVAFSQSTKAVQARKGSRDAYRRVEERGSWRTRVTPDIAAFIDSHSHHQRLREMPDGHAFKSNRWEECDQCQRKWPDQPLDHRPGCPN